MCRSSALKKVGLLEDAFVMYHEDLELGLRLRIAGYKNVLCSGAQALHDYSFSRNPNKFKWIELYKWMVVFSYWKIGTLVLLSPVLLTVEIGSFFLSIKGGWQSAKFWSYGMLCSKKTWDNIFRMRSRVKNLRKIKDKELLKFVSGKIENQEVSNIIIDKIANPILSVYVEILKIVVFW
ncbi:hypothetical protein KJ766_01935 [Patescibacteria group bacterium]|nr:hypothetical protein [Patescibacteria group bacterium]